MENSEVRFIDDRVTITMTKEAYVNLLNEVNNFAQAMNHVGECWDFDLHELRNMDSLRYSLRSNLGFEMGEHHWSNYKLPLGRPPLPSEAGK